MLAHLRAQRDKECNPTTGGAAFSPILPFTSGLETRSIRT
jgi:hypothetical protein